MSLTLDTEDLPELHAAILALVAEVRAARDSLSPGGERLTRAERRRVLRAAAAVGVAALEVVD